MAQAVEEYDIHRDGISQAERQLPALNPDYILVDERSTKDLLAFAKNYAADLNFFEVRNGEPTKSGNWQSFFADIDLDEAAAYLKAPEKFLPERAYPYARPHFALFLTFLQLLRHVQDQLNGLTKRHLDYYYQQILRLTKRGPIADHVNVLVDLPPRTEQFALPAGTLLDAGTDSRGQPLVYRTDTDITANEAQMAKLHTVFADRSAVGLEDIWKNKNIPDEEALIRLFEMTWGDPAPGDPLPDYPLTPPENRKPIVISGDNDQTIANFEILYRLVDFVPGTLHLDFAEYRNLVARKNQLDKSSDDWNIINQILQKAWRAKVADTGQDYDFIITEAKYFESNLKNALNLSDAQVEDLFDGIPGVVTLKDAYSRRSDSLVRTKINANLYLPVDESDTNGSDGLTFTSMMQRLIPIDSNWAEIIRILTLANPESRDIQELKLKDFASFDDILVEALKFNTSVPYPEPFAGDSIGDLTNYDEHLQQLKSYFYLPVPDFHYFMDLALPDEPTSDNGEITPEWAKVFDLLIEAHQKKVYSNRKASLRAVQEADEGGFDAMLYLALGVDEPSTDQDPLDLLDQYTLSAENLEFLAEMRSQRDTIANDDPDWEKTYQIVERIQRVILPKPQPQIETWRNLHPLENAKSAVVKLGIQGEAESTRWQTFGQAITGAAPPEPRFGWAISSPMLDLSQGMRTVTLTLGFDPKAFQSETLSALLAYEPLSESETPPPIPFRIEVSTEAGWVSTIARTIEVASLDEADLGGYWQLTGQTPPDSAVRALAGIQFELYFAEDVDPLTPLPLEEPPVNTPWPTLRLMMQVVPPPKDTLLEDDYTPYLTFKELILRRVHLQVKVENLYPSHIQNDEAILKPDKPFEPFGLRPAVGSRFYLTHPELVKKKLDSLDFKVEWMGWPENIGNYYANYNDAEDAKIVSGDDSFEITVSLINKQKTEFSQTDVSLHQPAVNLTDDIDRLLDFDAPAAVTAWDRYIQWELNSPDFQHSTYPARAAQLAVEMAADIANKTPNPLVPQDYQINPPYTPKIKSLTLTYTSSEEIEEVSKYQTGAETDQLYHIQPFGYSEVQPEVKLAGAMFLPQFDYEGELYIGLRNLGTAQTLSLLFQLAEGSANPDLPVEPVRWHYLSGNRWVSLEQGQLLSDGTRGLINTGILRFKLKAAQPNTLLDPNLYWLRAAIRRHSNGVCDTIDIHTQAVSATFVDQDNAPDHLREPLPPETITDLSNPKPQVAAIRQPYPSYGGKMPEQDGVFYTRISERLRHKDRALARWDYEHLILERFPQIYKVKCLPAPPDQPGQVTVIVIPDIRHNALFDPFEPKVAANVIADIKAYLVGRISAHASVTVKNPHYVPVKVRFAVRFQPDVDEGYAKQQLNDDLNRFLSPWAYDEVSEIVIGGRIYANTIINFIEERPYVDFVAEIRLFKSEDGQTFTLIQRIGTRGYWVEPVQPDGVLAAARQHEIDLITEAGYDADNFKGINYMRIELDFVVG